MNINDTGLNLIKQSEGCRLTAYQDSVGKWTIGYGCTGPFVKAGVTITQEQADDLLHIKLHQFESGVLEMVKTQLNSNEFSALVCFSYNVGLGNLRGSTLLHKLNADDRQGAADEFLVWNRAGGHILPGLTTRRQKERELFLTSNNESVSADDVPSDAEINSALAAIEQKILQG